MTAMDEYPAPERVEPDRDRWGRPLVIPPEGGKATAYTRCTTYVDCLDDKWKLQEWQQRMVALGLTQRRDLFLAYSSIAGELMNPKPSTSAKNRANDLCSQAREAAAASAAATTGTALHLLAERLDRGYDLGVIPDDAAADLRAYETTTKPLTALHIEQFTVQDDLKIGGTPDRVVRYEGENYIADLKTGSIEWGSLKIAMQLAVYAHSRFYDVTSGTRSNLPDVDRGRGIVIHLPAGSGECRLHWIDIDAGWAAVDVARQVREWRKVGRKLLSPLDVDTPLPFDDAPLPADLGDQIANAATVTDLTDLWARNRDRWTEHHTELATARKQTLGA